MKRVLPALFMVAFFCQCNNKLVVKAPYKDISVVYGLIDQNDTTHYIRINKAFEGEGDAFTMAQQYDSVNYPAGTFTVQIQDYSNGTLVNTYTFLPTTNVPVDPGIFSYPNQIVYYSKAKFNPNDQFNLVITNNKTGNVITGSTTLLSDVAVENPITYLGNGTMQVFQDNTSPFTVSWFSVAGSDIYQSYMRFYYREIDTIKLDTLHKYVDWVFPARNPSAEGGGYPMFFNYSGMEFYQTLAENISSAVGTSLKRYMDSAHVVFSTGSPDLNTYIQLSQPSLSVNQDKPFYTDLKNGVGIFTARHIQTATKTIGSSFVKALQTDSLTVNLNFK